MFEAPSAPLTLPEFEDIQTGLKSPRGRNKDRRKKGEEMQVFERGMGDRGGGYALCSSIYRYGTITRLGAIGKKGLHLFRIKSTNAHSTNESVTKETVKRVLYTFPVEEEDVRDGDLFEPNEFISNAVRSLEDQTNKAFEAGNVRIRKSYAIEMSDKGYRKFEDKWGAKLKVRLKGIDAPEFKMSFHKKSIEALSYVLTGEKLVLHEYKIKNDAYLDGDDHGGKEPFVQKHMLLNGYAWWHHRLDERHEFKEWHRQAKRARSGLWIDPNPKDYKQKSKAVPLSKK